MASEEEPINIRVQEDNSVRMAGYLDKRGKMKLVSTWKRYWFVLKDQLLLYYKSQMECHNLSACRGSLNMGLASCVRPGPHRGPPATGTQGYTIEVVTRTQVITLRTKDRALQEQWLKALLESMALPNISTPLRNSGGPMHFRYSLDNLPVVEELEKDDKSKEKQKTLPHRTSITRHDSVLGRIKRIGGQSYGGSLDTILKRRPSNKTAPQQHSPQQPKIPRIKAVDRMLGLQYNEEQETEREEHQCLNSDDSASPINDSQNVRLLNKERHYNGSTRLGSKEKLSMSSTEVEIEHTTDVSSYAQVASISGKELSLKQNNFRRENESTHNIEESAAGKDENQNHANFNLSKTEETTNLSNHLPENQKCLSLLENKDCILVENKLYEKSSKRKSRENDHESGNKSYEKNITNCDGNMCLAETKLKEKINLGVKKQEQYSSEEELSSFQQVQKASEGEKMYEDMSACTKTIKQVEKNRASIADEDEYYCKYDKVSLVQSLSDQNGSSPEPDLPPRPSVGSNDSSKYQHQTVKTEDDDAEYYETTESFSVETTSSPSQVVSSGGDGSVSEKKKLKLRGKMKLRKKKSPSKESVGSDEGTSNNKKKRKMSFLRRMLKHYRKKPDANSEPLVASDTHGSSDEPEYETVDYTIPMLSHKINDEEKKRLPSAIEDDISESPEKEVHKERLFGTKSLLTDQAMIELKKKLKVRDDGNVPINEENEGYECISSDDVTEKKPVPTPRLSKQKSNQNGQAYRDPTVESCRYRCNEGINRINKPPSLPPRKVARPRSPWHDVPKNNSPVYGNFNDLRITIENKKEDKPKEVSEHTVLRESEPQAAEWDEELQDELLGTPRGFAYIQKKWKAVEKSCELHRDQRQGSFQVKGKSFFQRSPQKETSPEKYFGAEGRKVRYVSNESLGGSSIRSDDSEKEHRTVVRRVSNPFFSDVHCDIHQDQSSAKTIVRSFNSNSEKMSDRYSDTSGNEDEVKDRKVKIVKERTIKVDSNEVLKEFTVGMKYSENLELSRNSELKLGNVKDHCNSSLSAQCVLNSDKGHRSCTDESTVILRKYQNEPCQKTEHNNLACVNDSLSSSQSKNDKCPKELTDEAKDGSHITNGNSCKHSWSNLKRISPENQQLKTMPNNSCSQNMIINTKVPENPEECKEGYDIMPRLNRHSDELNLLLAQLAEITSAPLLPQASSTSLDDLPDSRKPKNRVEQPSQHNTAQPESFMLGPIRRRRHSDPDYDVPRPHGSLLHLLAPNRTSRSGDQGQAGQESDVIEATRFFGDADLTSNSTRSSLSLRHSVISEVDDQSDSNYYVSMAPDSLEVSPAIRSIERSS